MNQGESRVRFQWCDGDDGFWIDCDLLEYESALREGFRVRRVVVLAGRLPVLPNPSTERGSDGHLTYEAKAHNACLDACADVVAGLQGQVDEFRKDLRITNLLLKSAKADRDAFGENAIDLKRRCAALRREIAVLTELIRDDAYAMAFQSMGQYRSALINAIAAGKSQ